MLKLRIITAVVLVALIIAALVFLPPAGQTAVAAVAFLLGAWEWAALAGLKAVLTRLLFFIAVALAMAWLYTYCAFEQVPLVRNIQPVMGVACLWWSVALLWVKGFPLSARLWGNMPMRVLMGFLVIIPAWLALAFILNKPNGVWLLVLLVAVVAFADIGAYFSGRAFGRHKLAPRVSPGKTWEGFWGGMSATAVLTVSVAYLVPNLPVSGLALGVIVLSTALASVVGDLLVSMVKRHCGVKDSGWILPGHGGMMDRIDSLAAASPVFALGLILAAW